jgi:hypothetical protein
MLAEMAAVLKIKVDQLRILKGAYAPKGWADEESLQRTGRTVGGRAWKR